MTRILALALAVSLTTPARADIADCAKLSGRGDDYWFCRAQGSGDDSNCASIRDNTLKRTCLSLTRHDPSECASIPNREIARKVNCQQRGR